MRNPLQEQLLKAGLVKKSQVAQVAREQAKARQGKTPPPPSAEQRESERLRQERVERDRALSAERNAQARAQELRAQARQLVESHKLKADGEIDYHFTDAGKIQRLRVDAALRAQLIAGSVVIARLDAGYVPVPRAVVERIVARDPETIVFDALAATPASGEDDPYYSQFQVPDDLIW
ncbi:DUF2058 domain-containing protein [Xanthomonas rydalmerensis]|uniref:DUF2058 domain-containing protein n=1 Tax=Xanthomonas rydalmerensis TaxID=3046274 RepID=A0ABZ0JKX9_9XANT|nr:DUF2058 domain-containing protein [Xanthomonas sp. DM-2023]WOS39663.1 DUF2058 domain-containing protein [Xanthomonas sp. DM-2023]WOS43847.1 DUF2058 domain-containing protein [Xanthomonas sp. DM-2023]WOS48027.1 DUF2058 domain-containing protein [Xanthomonas sp. DM-2023]WOS52206.1 DUF2058 domain-containing protein [Xanthomonas sp. DM-2023]WOS56390.1 DUF2058 domain-containing protein [Xanthomonas sp. DM-2023]